MVVLVAYRHLLHRDSLACHSCSGHLPLLFLCHCLVHGALPPGQPLSVRSPTSLLKQLSDTFPTCRSCLPRHFFSLSDLVWLCSAARNPSPVKLENPSAPADSDNKASEPYDNNSDEEADDDEDARLPPRKPFTRTMQKQEKEAPQKWVQCARCNKWRRVGYPFQDGRCSSYASASL